jgi:uncharacterized protein YkwD
MAKNWPFNLTRSCNDNPPSDKKPSSFLNLRRPSSQSKGCKLPCERTTKLKQQAERKLKVELDNTYLTKDVIDRHNCWEYLGTSTRNLMEKTSESKPSHTRNRSDETTTSTLSAISIDAEKLQAAMEFGKVVNRNRKLPPVLPGFLSGNHLLVNKERISRHIPALSRRLELDLLARERAAIMARIGKIRHGDSRLMLKILSPCKCYAENVACGVSVQEIHLQMLTKDSDLKNMTDRCFAFFGMGTAIGKHGNIYLCQIFTG